MSIVSPLKNKENTLKHTILFKHSNTHTHTHTLTETHGAALVLRLDGARTGEDWTDDRVTDHCALLQGGQRDGGMRKEKNVQKKRWLDTKSFNIEVETLLLDSQDF